MDSVLPGPALTAIGVAMIRSTESCRPDALYRDPWAQRFVDDARAFVSPTDWTQVSTLADRMYESRTIGVRLVDDVLLDASPPDASRWCCSEPVWIRTRSACLGRELSLSLKLICPRSSTSRSA